MRENLLLQLRHKEKHVGRNRNNLEMSQCGGSMQSYQPMRESFTIIATPQRRTCGPQS
jgi:hypothetical protein